MEYYDNRLLDDELISTLNERIKPKLTKSTDGFISKYLNRPISIPISTFLSRYKIHPNHMTLVSFFIAVLAAGLIALGEIKWVVLGGFLVQVASILDGCDGEIARLKLLHSNFGAWLDRVLDRYADALILLAMTRALWIDKNAEWVWFLGFTAMLGTFLNSYTATEFDKIIKKNLEIKRYFRFGRDTRLFVIFLGTILNQLFLTLLVIAITTNIETFRRLFIFRHEIKNSRTNRTGNIKHHKKIPRRGRLSARA